MANSASALNLELLQSDTILSMRDIFTLLLHAIVIIVRLGRPGGLRSVVAESVLLRHQVLILTAVGNGLPTFGPRIASSRVYAHR